jgi:hypothetical protein
MMAVLTHPNPSISWLLVMQDLKRTNAALASELVQAQSRPDQQSSLLEKQLADKSVSLSTEEHRAV